MVPRALLILAIGLTWTGAGCRSHASAPTHHASPDAARRVDQPRGPGSAPKTPAPPPATAPITRESCQACRGLWAVHGLDDKESCNCRTTDAGKRCQDGVDCQGSCIASKDDPQVEVLDPGPPARGVFVGRCSELVTAFGCNRVIERGATARGPVPLGEPPPIICVD